MEVEQIVPQAEDGLEKKAKDVMNSPVSNHEGEPQLNGMSNGYERKKEHKSEHRDKDKERSHKSEHRDKERSKDKHKSEHRDRDKDKDRHKHSSSSSKDKDKSSSSKDKDRKSSSSKHHSNSSSKDKDKDKEKHREKDKEREREKDKDREKDRDKDKERKDKDKNHKSSSSKDKHHSSSGEKKDRDKERDKDKEKDRNREKDKERSKDKDKDKHRHSSNSHSLSSRDKDKEKSSKDRHSDKDRSPDKHRSSSQKDKHRHDKDKDRHRHDKDREKSKHSEDKEKKEKVKEEKVKEEPMEIVSKFKEEQESFNKEDSDSGGDQLYIKDEDEDMREENNSMDDTADTRLSDMHNTTLKTEEDYEEEEDEDEDMPLAARKSEKRKMISDDEDDEVPLASRKKPKKESKKIKKEESDDDFVADNYDDDYEEKPKKSKKKKRTDDSDDDFEAKKSKKKKKIKKEESEDEDFDEKPKKKKKVKAVPVKEETSPTKSPKKKKKEEEEQEVWKWWEEEKKDDGNKWNFLEHKGPVFAPDYEPLPKSVKFFYDGKEMKLSQDTEEVATFYARMLEHDYTTKQVFNDNFFHDWREVMTKEEREKIRDLRKCNFTDMHKYFIEKSEERKAMSKDEKKAIKEKNEEIIKEYGFCQIDGHKEKIGNFKIEPPGLFRGRGEHPKMGKLKKRVNPEDIMINCSKDSVFPKPPPGRKWKEIRHDPTVTWLASWTENVQGAVKYVMLNPSSKLKGEKDWQKYETARKLAKCVDKIRTTYREDWKSKEMRIRQRAVALYFIDKLALRAGNEKDEDQADTVGCCSLRVEHITLHEKKDDKNYVVAFDFLGKDSIRYQNEVEVEKRVFKSLQLFMQDKQKGDDLFDRLNTAVMNKHLNELMEGLTAKVFRTFNASWTLQQQLNELTKPDESVTEKILSYNRANRAVAILCNHQRAVPKTHEKSMGNLKEKLVAKQEAVANAEKAVKEAKRDAKNGSVKEKVLYEKKKKQLERMREQLKKLDVSITDKEENKEIALGTSKLNYLDPRISVAWCKKHDVPIEKIYNKTQRDKFRWAIDMAGPDYVF